MRRRLDEKEKEMQEERRTSQSETNLGKFGRWLFLLLLLGHNLLCVSAAAEGPHRRKEVMVRMQQEVQVKEGRWCALLDGSAFSVQRKVDEKKQRKV